MPRDVTKTDRIIVRVSPEESNMLGALSEHSGLTMSDVVRQLIRKAHAETVESKPRRPRKR